MQKIFFIFVLLISFVGNAQQNDKGQILKDSESFIVALQEKDYDHFFDLMYPTVFEYVSRELFLKIFKSFYEGNEEFKVEIINSDKTKFVISEIFSDVSDAQYAFVNYPLTMKMTFNGQSFEDEEEKQMMKNIMKMQGMDIEFMDDKSMRVEMQSMTIAIKDKKTENQWRYLNHDEDNPHHSLFVSPEILRKAKDYYYDFILKQKENAS